MHKHTYKRRHDTTQPQALSGVVVVPIQVRGVSIGQKRKVTAAAGGASLAARAGDLTHPVSTMGHRDRMWTPEPCPLQGRGTPAVNEWAKGNPPSRAARASSCLSSDTKTSCRQRMSMACSFFEKAARISSKLRHEEIITTWRDARHVCRSGDTLAHDPDTITCSPLLATLSHQRRAPHVLQGKIRGRFVPRRATIPTGARHAKARAPARTRVMAVTTGSVSAPMAAIRPRCAQLNAIGVMVITDCHAAPRHVPGAWGRGVLQGRRQTQHRRGQQLSGARGKRQLG
jgi:hypothetical protein